jgi:hypothetical protein
VDFVSYRRRACARRNGHYLRGEGREFISRVDIEAELPMFRLESEQHGAGKEF